MIINRIAHARLPERRLSSLQPAPAAVAPAMVLKPSVSSVAAGRNGRAPACRQLHTAQRPTIKRLYDATLSAIGLLLLSPVFLLIALAIKLASRGPVFYRQTRIGQFGVPFRIWKFRTMVPDADRQGLTVTGEGDQRITRLGRRLRQTKLDELPQLLNVLQGEMSLVGPRPEVPRYIEQYTAEQREILRYKPGITDLASICFRNEEALLSTAEDTEAFYMQYCVPRKLALNQEYARKANTLTDTWLVLQTICPYWAGVLGLYAVVLSVALWLAEGLVSNFQFGRQDSAHFAGQLAWVVGTQLACLLGRRHYTGLLGYFGLPELGQLARGLSQATLLLLGFSFFLDQMLPARNLLLMDFCTASMLLCGFRLSLRLWGERVKGKTAEPVTPPLRVAIIGAGRLGAQLAHCLNTEKHLGRTAVVFFDDDFAKWQKRIHNVPVAGMPECLLQGWSEKLDEVALALPNAAEARLRELRQLLENTGLKVYAIHWPLSSYANSSMA